MGLNMDKTQQVYNFIKEFIKNNKYPPSIREICNSIKLESTSSVVYHLKKLEKLGMITRNNNKNRAIELVDDESVGEIGKGYLLFVGVFDGDQDENAIKMADKISKLRIFKDENGKTNLSLSAVEGEILSVSQFTLCADTNQGNRPSFVNSARREDAIRLYELVNEELRKKGFNVKTGVFGADMKVELINDGPFTLVLEN